MRALVTGGSGYLGHVLVNKLVEKGYTVSVFDLNDTEGRATDIQFFRGDIRDADAVSKACERQDVVFHNVAQVPLAKDKELFNSVNELGTQNLLDACFKQQVKKVIYTSSSAVFGVPKENPVTEETPPTPAESYGAAKLAGETLCFEYQKRGIDVSILRPRTILGHGRLGIFQILFDWIKSGNNIPVLGKGDNTYQFVHADDFADASILASLEEGAQIYNIGAEVFGTMRQTLEELCTYAGTGSKVKSVPLWPAVIGMNLTSTLGLSPLGPYHALMYGRSMYFDITKAKTRLNWSPRYSNVDMFRESYDWYLNNFAATTSSDQLSHHRRGVKQGILSLVKLAL